MKKIMKEIKVPKMDISFGPEKKKGSQIEKAIEMVGAVNTKHSHNPIRMEHMLHRHGKEKFHIDLDD